MIGLPTKIEHLQIIRLTLDPLKNIEVWKDINGIFFKIYDIV